MKQACNTHAIQGESSVHINTKHDLANDITIQLASELEVKVIWQ